MMLAPKGGSDANATGSMTLLPLPCRHAFFFVFSTLLDPTQLDSVCLFVCLFICLFVWLSSAAVCISPRLFLRPGMGEQVAVPVPAPAPKRATAPTTGVVQAGSGGLTGRVG